MIRYFFIPLLLMFCFCTKDQGFVNKGNYPPEIGKIIVQRCAVSGCHNSLSFPAAGGLNLTSWNSLFSGSRNGAAVIPFSSKFSSLCYFINTYPELGIQNKPTMPLYAEPLSFDEVRLIKNWIANGARDINGKVMWADNPQRKKLYAVNQGCDVVTVFDSESRLPIRYIEVGTKFNIDSPHQIRVSPDGKFWYVIFINNNVMQKFRCSDDTHMGDIPLTPLASGIGTEDAQDWNTFVISKDSKRAYCVSTSANGKLAEVDLETMKLKKFIGGQNFPHGIVLSPMEDKIFIASQTGNFITEIDSSFSGSIEHVLENGPKNLFSSLDPHEMILSPDQQNIIITCQKSNEVRFFNLKNNTVESVVATGTFPQEIVYSKNSNQYYISCTNDSVSFPGSLGTITKIDATNKSVSKIKCGYQPHGIAVDEGKNMLYVLSRNISTSGPAPHHSSQCAGRNGYVSFIDLKTFTLLPERFELSVDPYYIFAKP